MIPSIQIQDNYISGTAYIFDSKKEKPLYCRRLGSLEETNDFLRHYVQPTPSFGIIKQLFFTHRTQGVGFVKDFFVPTVNLARKIDNAALRVLACLAAAIVDLITFVPRALLTPGRLIYVKFNPAKPHPLVEDKLIDAKYKRVCVSLEIKTEQHSGGMMPSAVKTHREYIHDIVIKQKGLAYYKHEQYNTIESSWHAQPRILVKVREVFD